jgi:hypothetical protein
MVTLYVSPRLRGRVENRTDYRPFDSGTRRSKIIVHENRFAVVDSDLKPLSPQI